jgi:hypothetical protein
MSVRFGGRTGFGQADGGDEVRESEKILKLAVNVLKISPHASLLAIACSFEMTCLFFVISNLVGGRCDWVGEKS